MLLSIVIPAFNEERILGQTLVQIHHALHENEDRGFSWEIIVCDNNSSDRTSEIASQMGAKVTFESINQISRARNTGAGIAEGNWLLFIDADSYPCPELMAEVLDVMEDGNYIGCGTTIVVESGTLFNKLRMERLNPLFRLFNWGGGAFLLCQVEAFRSIGGFSTSLYAYEEIDFVFRLKRYGRKVGKKFTVIHRYPVVTSGRKGDYGFFTLGVLFISNFMAVVLLVLHYLLPIEFIAKLGSKLLGYWYRGRR
jgi:glycosyltransferase involved in cell wall biosynthesis